MGKRKSSKKQQPVWDDRLRSILDAALDAVVATNSEGQIVQWSARAAAVFGWQASEAMGRDLADLVLAERARAAFRRQAQQRLDASGRSGPAQSGEAAAVRRGGDPLIVEYSMAAVDNGAENILYTFFHDATAQRAERGELHDSQENLSQILESTIDAIFGIDLQGVCTFANAACLRILGYDTADELVGRSIHRLIHHTRSDGSKYPPSECRIYEACQRGAATHVDDEVFWRKDGASVPVDYRSYPIEREGRTTGAVVTFVDVREREEEALYRSQMTALVDSSYEAIIGKDLHGRIISWNAGAERVYGYTEDEALGQTVHLITPAEAGGEEPEILQAMQTGQRLEQFETVRRRKDGRLFPVSLTVSPIVDSNGRVIGISTIGRDVTDRKRAEEELRQAKEAAEKASRVRGEFLANVSHELRSPMNSILGMIQLALEEDLSDEVREYIQTAGDSAHSLLKLLNDILDFSKLESGKFTIEREPFSLRETIEDTVRTLSSRAFEKGLEIICDIAADAPDKLVGDSLRLRQILTNLVNNAIKFTEQGEVVVQVEALRKWPQETRLKFSVIDTGIGLSTADQQRILEPFTQVDASATRRHGGTGLGLAICSELLRLMGSRLSISSAPNEGSRFSFRLSLHRQDDETTTLRSAIPVDQLVGLRVLAVDDNETSRRILRDTLASWSMEADVAQSGDEALEMVRSAARDNNSYRLIIVDALMPGIDGYAFSQAIAEELSAAPPIILMVSSTDRHEFKEREEKANITAYVHKPVTQSDLMDAMMRALNVQAPPVDPMDRRKSKLGSTAALSVLLVEDTPANQKVVATLLKKRGHDVAIAQNGREAIEMFKKSDFDAVLMDIQMPILDGFQTTAVLRDLEKDYAEPTPIIAMTAHAMHGDREKCLEAGMDAYIAKPIDVQHLLALIESVAENSAPAKAPPKPSHPDDPIPVFDFAAAMKRLGQDKELYREFIGFFDEDAPRLLKEMRNAIDNNDPPALHRAAHSLKGLAANFGAEPTVAVALELERLGKSRTLAAPACEEALARLMFEAARLDEALDVFRK